MTNSQAAIACAGPEFTRTMKLLMGFSARTKIAFSVFFLELFSKAFAEKYGKQYFGFATDETWFSKHIFGLIETDGGFNLLSTLLKQPIPFKLMVELLRPYVFNMRTKKCEIKSINSKKLFSVFL